MPTSQINNYAAARRHAEEDRRVDGRVHAAAVNPIFLEHLDTLWIMSKAWSEKHKVTQPLDFKNKEESYAALNANGTGPYMLASRAPGIKTTYKRNPNYWGKVEGNVAGGRLHADRQRRDAAGGAGLGRGRLRPRPGPARHRPAAQHAGRQGDRRAGEPGRLHRHGPGPRRTALQQRQGQEPVQGRPRPPRALPGDRHRDAEDEAHERAELPDRRGDAVAARHLQRPGARAALSVRSRRGEEAAGRRRLPRRLRGPAPLPEQPLRQRRADLHRPGRHVGADQGQGQGHASRARPTSRSSRSTTSACTCSAGAARSPTPRRR